MALIFFFLCSVTIELGLPILPKIDRGIFYFVDPKILEDC